LSASAPEAGMSARSAKTTILIMTPPNVFVPPRCIDHAATGLILLQSNS
jgi:hypothetical protein